MKSGVDAMPLFLQDDLLGDLSFGDLEYNFQTWT